MYSFEDLIEKVKQWGRDRNLTDPANLKNQFFKLVSEFGEIGQGIHEESDDKIEDGVGDTMVVCIILGEQLGCSLTIDNFDRTYEFEDDALVLAQSTLGLLADTIAKGQIEESRVELKNFLREVCSYCYLETSGLHNCLRTAYEEIKDRKGVLYNGVFIKESDPRYESARAELGLVPQSLNRPPEQ